MEGEVESKGPAPVGIQTAESALLLSLFYVLLMVETVSLGQGAHVQGPTLAPSYQPQV